jgi:hypothetical protein
VKPSIERELEAIRQMLRDLEARLKNDRVELGHREVFSIGRKGEVPAPSTADRDANKVLGVGGWVTGSGGLSTVFVDGITIGGDGSAQYPLSGTIQTGSFADLSGTINSAFLAHFSASQVWSQTANGGEGNTMTAVLPWPFANNVYYAFVTSHTASDTPVLRITNKTSASFQIVNANDWISGERVDILAVSGGMGGGWDGSQFANFSGTFAATIASLSQSINAKFIDTSGSVDGHFNALSGTVNSGIVALSGAIDSKLQFLPVSNIWDKPRSPHPYDDEFESTALDGAWSWDGNPGTAGNIDPYATFVGDLRYELHTNRRRSWIMMQPSTVGTRLLKTVTFTTNMFVWTRLSFNARSTVTPVNNDSTIALDLGLVTGWTLNDRVAILLNEQDAGTIQCEFFKVEGGTLTSLGTTADLFGTVTDAQPIEAVGIQKLGTTYHGWAFTGAGSALWMGSTVWTGSIGTVTIATINAAATSPGNMIVGADFIRFVTSSVWLP